MSEETPFVDGESTTGYFHQELSFRSIVLNHLIKINNICCKEFHGGYWTTRVKGVGNATYTEKIYVPDVLEEYSNSISQLADLLLPHYDEPMKTAEEEHFKTAKSVDKKDRTGTKHLYRQLFRSLSTFLRRQGYLEVGDISDS